MPINGGDDVMPLFAAKSGYEDAKIKLQKQG